MKIVIRKWDVFDDWYVIEREDVDGTKHVGDGVKMSRICGARTRSAPEGYSADIEGTAYEMREIAAAIENRGEVGFKRCAVDATGEVVRLGSPRNDNGIEAEVSIDEADDLARQIREMLGS